MSIMNGVVMKGKKIVVLEVLQKQMFQQLHINHMSIEKTKILVHKSLNWIGINADIENHIKNCSACLDFQ